MIAYGHTDVGRKRQDNQDFYAISPSLRVAVVCDGIGGYGGGSLASRIAAERFVAVWAEMPNASDEDRTIEGIAQAHAAIEARKSAASGSDGHIDKMGTTIVSLTVDRSGFAVVGNVGDSRAYLLRAGTLHQITHDHALAGLPNALTRALGAPTHHPDVFRFQARPGDRMLLCSDGLYGEIPDDDICAKLRTCITPETAAHTLVTAANESGGRDNITAVVVDL